ncbi:pollen receptor-like kinase 4 [Macadamia integrifolia]|uniref:pollen receptor-like kinase 4 n=1 Tax=Macadamia integrifolia TaxID=60698 RepID=UPI001C4F404A|nr:pollen receptor-like kinase 4 [Macadamia integrifolia]
MARSHSPWALPIIFFVVVFIIDIHVVVMAASASSESNTLLKFKASIAKTTALDSWNASTSPCTSWVGVRCIEGTVRGLQLENMGLSGTIDVESLMGLQFLRSISFLNNSFNCPIPSIWKLGALKSVYLSENQFSGEIPDDAFEEMGSLKFLYLADNKLTGKIPSSLAKLPKLLELELDGNKFEGNIPDFQQKNLRLVRVANNQLEGPIPATLSNMDSSSFAGNKGLCGAPLGACETPSKKSSSLPIIIAGFVAVVVVAVLVVAVVAVSTRRRSRQTEQLGRPSSISSRKKVVAFQDDQMETRSQDHSTTSSSKGENGRLTFVRDDRERFELQDLLRASAEVLGSGSFGSSYKAVLTSGKAMVVKRFRHMNKVGREDFQEHMRRLGRLRHPNLLPLVAYYYRKEEKLLVSDFIGNGSLASRLHSNRTEDQQGLDWPIRLKIIKGATSAMAYLHKELPSLSVPHAHLKSSNVILNESCEPLLTDYGLLPVVNNEHAAQIMVAYKSPEYAEHGGGRVTKKSDVWCLGTLILELLTGKLPMNYLKQGKGNSHQEPDLASWVNSVPREEWTGEVFDTEMAGTRNGEGEMMKLLKIGLSCCEVDVEKRLDLDEAVEKIGEVRERDNDDGFSCSYASEDMYSAREEDFSHSMNRE